MEVVATWWRVPPSQRHATAQFINDELGTYDLAFYCVSKLGNDPIEKLPCTTKVVYGPVRIEDAKECFWLRSMKLYQATDGTRQLSKRKKTAAR